MILRRLTLILAFLSASLGFATAPGTASASTPSALAGLQSCLGETKNLNLVFLVDTSGSLQTSDPHNARVTAIEAELAALEASSRSGALSVHVSMVGFATTTEVVAPWTQLSSATAGPLQRAAQEFASMNTGATTDFPRGLAAAWQQIVAATTVRPNSCSAVIWFTDGAIDLGPSVSHASAVRSMCTRGGAPDVLASSGVYTFAVGLGDTGGMQPDDETELRSYVLGTPNDVTASCGRSISPSTGQFFAVHNAAFLMFALQAALDPSVPAVPNASVTCASIARCSPVATPWFGPGIGGAQISATTGSAVPLAIVVSGPRGSVRLDPSSTSATLSGVEAHYTVLTSGSIAASLDVVDAAAATGNWSIQFLSPSRAPVYYWVGLTPSVRFALTPRQSFTRGAAASPGVITLVDRRSAMPVSGLRLTGVTATVAGLGDPSASPQSLNLTPSGDSWHYSFANTFPDPSATVTVSGTLVAGPSAEMVPIQQTIVASAPLPADYPTIVFRGATPKTLHQGTPLVLHYLVAASDGVSGCLGTVVAHRSAGTPAVRVAVIGTPRTQVTCTVVAPGSPVAVAIRVSTTSPNAGITPVVATFGLRGRPTSQWITTRVSTRVVVTRVVNLARSLLVLLGVLAVGLLVLLVELRLLNKRYASLLPPPIQLLVKTSDIALGANREGLVFLDPEVRGEATFDPPSTITDGVAGLGEGAEPVRSFEFAAGGELAYRLEARDRGPLGLLTLLSGALTTRVRPSLLNPGLEFLAGRVGDPQHAIRRASEQSFSSRVVVNSWFFAPSAWSEHADLVKDSAGMYVATGPYLLGQLTVLVVEPSRVRDVVEHARASLNDYYQDEAQYLSEASTLSE